MWTYSCCRWQTEIILALSFAFSNVIYTYMDIDLYSPQHEKSTINPTDQEMTMLYRFKVLHPAIFQRIIRKVNLNNRLREQTDMGLHCLPSIQTTLNITVLLLLSTWRNYGSYINSQVAFQNAVTAAYYCCKCCIFVLQNFTAFWK